VIVFRAIKRDTDGRPWLSNLVARGLGVRPDHDISPDEEGVVHPYTGGTSVSTSPDALPPFLRDEPVWALETADLPGYLRPREDPDREGHVFIEPAYSMDLGDFQDAIAETRDLWREV
jgi:hypothetical protein